MSFLSALLIFGALLLSWWLGIVCALWTLYRHYPEIRRILWNGRKEGG